MRRGSRGLVDRVAAEDVELGRQEVARTRRPAPRPRDRLAVDGHALDLAGGPMGQLDLLLQPRPEPAREQERVRLRPGDRQRLGRLDVRPERREARAPAEPTAPGDVRHGDPVVELLELPVGRREVAPLGRVDDEPVADVDELLQLRRAPRRQPAPAAERRQVGDEERLDDRAGHPRALPAQTELDHVRAHLARRPVDREALQVDVDVDPVSPLRVGEEQDRPRGMQLLEPGERPARRGFPLRRRPGHVGHHARARPLAVLRAQLRQLPLHLGHDAQWRLQLRPSRWIRSSADLGPHVPAG